MKIQTSDLETDVDLEEIEAVAPEASEEPQTVEEPTETTEEVIETPEEPQEPEQTSVVPDGYVPKEKFVASQREAMLQVERNKVKDAQLEQLTKTDTPTDEYMRSVYPDWDEYNDVTKRVFMKSEAQELKQRRTDALIADFLQEKQTNSQLDEEITRNPKLAGKEAEFKKYASNPKNKGIPADSLAKIFLFDLEEENPVTPQKKPVLPTGNGGSREPLKPKKVSLEDAAKIRKASPSKYMELVKNDMIEDIE